MSHFNPRYGTVYLNELTLINPSEPERSIKINLHSEADDIFRSLKIIDVDEVYIKGLGGYLYRGENYTVPFNSLNALDVFLSAYEQAVSNDLEKADKINAVIEAEGVNGVGEAIYLIEHSDEFNFYPGIKNVTELGRLMFSQRFGEEVVKEAGYFIDCETYGRDYMDFHDYGCKMTEHGFIERTEEFRSYESIKDLEEIEALEL